LSLPGRLPPFRRCSRSPAKNACSFAPKAGEEFFLGTADELRSEAALLSQNPGFTCFLDERFTEKATISLEELEAEAS
jgi:hypothetical protein